MMEVPGDLRILAYTCTAPHAITACTLLIIETLLVTNTIVNHY